MARGTLKIFSGGQTGVDRAALDAAIEKRLSYGGWCPRGGWAEDLPEPPGLLAIYPHLQETPLSDPAQRTQWNLRDANRLMVLVDHAGLTVSKGTESARGFAEKLGRPLIVLDLDVDDALDRARGFLDQGEGAHTLCIAGPRESEAAGIYLKARTFLLRLL